MRSEVVHGVLSNIMPFLLWLSSSHDELVVQVQLNASKVLRSIFDFLINSEVWHSVINWVSKTCFFVSVLITTCWWADWVRFSVDISISLGKWFSWNRSREVIVLINFPFMFEGRFLCCSVLKGVDDVSVSAKVWYKVVLLKRWIRLLDFPCVVKSSLSPV